MASRRERQLPECLQPRPKRSLRERYRGRLRSQVLGPARGRPVLPPCCGPIVPQGPPTGTRRTAPLWLALGLIAVALRRRRTRFGGRPVEAAGRNYHRRWSILRRGAWDLSARALPEKEPADRCPRAYDSRRAGSGPVRRAFHSPVRKAARSAGLCGACLPLGSAGIGQSSAALQARKRLVRLLAARPRRNFPSRLLLPRVAGWTEASSTSWSPRSS